MMQPPHNGTPSSRAAANEIEPVAGKARAAVLDYLRSRDAAGATADEIEQDTCYSGYTIRPRLVELERLGRARKTSATRPARTDRKAVVWMDLPGSQKKRLTPRTVLDNTITTSHLVGIFVLKIEGQRR